MAQKKLKVILDTNIWISFLITKTYLRLDQYLINGKIKLIFSEELLTEFLEVTKRPKLKAYFSPENVSDLIEYFNSYAQLINVKSNIKICRDPKDNFLLSLAKDSNADYLVTGDKDLLVIEKFGTTIILTIENFMKLLA